MNDYRKYINALKKCAKEHENDRTFTGHIIVSDLCRDTANLLEALEQEPKTGYWISTETKGVRYAFWCRYKCSLCGGLSDHTTFCPNCGARMVEPQESENV